MVSALCQRMCPRQTNDKFIIEWEKLFSVHLELSPKRLQQSHENANVRYVCLMPPRELLRCWCIINERKKRKQKTPRRKTRRKKNDSREYNMMQSSSLHVFQLKKTTALSLSGERFNRQWESEGKTGSTNEINDLNARYYSTQWEYHFTPKRDTKNVRY